jgi:hypothetical protein
MSKLINYQCNFNNHEFGPNHPQFYQCSNQHVVEDMQIMINHVQIHR